MKKYKRIMCIFTIIALLCCNLNVFAAENEKMPRTASEMTCGANLSDLYIADIQSQYGETYSYDNLIPKSEFGLGIWFWDNSFEWLCYHNEYSGTFTVTMNIPDFNYASTLS